MSVSPEAPSETIRTLIAKARAIAEIHGDALWNGWNTAPFGVLLVEETRETLFCHDGPAGEWRLIGKDPLTGCVMRTRPHGSLPLGILASFPAVDGVPTIVIGTPEATGRSPVSWMVTLLHEHMHQRQYTEANYYAGVAALDLAGDDTDAAWMLNYPFPYDRPKTVMAFTKLVTALDAAVVAIGGEGFQNAMSDYLDARQALRATVSDADWRYFEFQLWQEGVARWTELALSEAAGAEDDDLAAHAAAMRNSLSKELAAIREKGVTEFGREAFYPIGASEALLLEAVAPSWRSRYFTEPFALGPYFPRP